MGVTNGIVDDMSRVILEVLYNEFYDYGLKFLNPPPTLVKNKLSERPLLQLYACYLLEKSRNNIHPGSCISKRFIINIHRFTLLLNREILHFTSL